jgi:serine/threonine-protein kinase
MENLTGKQLGPYRIIEPLGEGGMAAVYKSYQPGMDRSVALKVLPRHFASDPQFLARFIQEARVIANLEHQNILPVYDFGESDGYTYLVMRFVDGGTLADLLQRERLSLPQVRHVVSQVGGAIAYAHARGVLHRDIKPSNVLIDATGNCLLGDFGLAKMAEGNSRLTQTGGIMGTPAYMSPEQGLGNPVDARTDIYALGVILYEIVTSRLPFLADTPVALILKHVHDPLIPPRIHNPELSEGFEQVILKALAKSPADRFATAGEMVGAVCTALRDVGDATLTPAARPVRPARPIEQPFSPLASPVKPIDSGAARQQAEALEKTGMQIRMYRKAGVQRGVGHFLLWLFGAFFLAYTGSLAYLLIRAIGGLPPATTPTARAPLGVIIALDVLWGVLAITGFRMLRASRRLKSELADQVDEVGNYYCCDCGEPMKNYSTAHWLWCCIPGWGLIALLFKLKKCTKCGKSYPNRLLATR